MQPNLETILSDIYELEPTLQGEAEAVRAIVTALLDNKPNVVLDAAFAARLRAELMQGKVGAASAVTSSGATVSPLWMWYAAPVGVFALLMLMLVPKYVHSPVFQPVPQSTDETAPTILPMQMSEPAADVVPGAATKRMADPAADSVMDVAATSLMMEPAGVPVDTYYIPTQLPGSEVFVEYATVSAPAFIVVFAGDPENSLTLLGVSPLIVPGATYVAALYYDDGDGVFDMATDIPMLDAAGLPLYQWFSTIPASM
jgi:hypothetical protein